MHAARSSYEKALGESREVEEGKEQKDDVEDAGIGFEILKLPQGG